MRKKILLIVATHGDEKIGVQIIQALKKKGLGLSFDVIVGNPKALAQRKRYLDSDLNRIFPGKAGGNYEERRARDIVRIGKDYEQVIDLHGSVSKTGIFIIITKFTLANLLLALRFDIKKIVVWPEARETVGSLSTFMRAGIEIEAGPKDDAGVKAELLGVLTRFLRKNDEVFDLRKRLGSKEIYVVSGKLTKEKDAAPKELKDWVRRDDYYLLFVGQYEKVWCYKLKKVDLLGEVI